MLDLKRSVSFKADALVPGVITLLAGIFRFVGIGTPKALMFDEVYYVPDACRYVIEARDLCGISEKTFFHPPLGKWLIAFGMEFLGPTRYGWRLMPALAGTIAVLVVYLLTRRLTGSMIAAGVAAGVLALDPLHFVHSRVAVLDIFVALFALMAVFFIVRDGDEVSGGIRRPWRLAAGLALGATVATKWTGIYFLPVVVGLGLWRAMVRREEPDEAKRGWLREIASAALFFVAIPLFVYLVSYAGRFDQPLLAVPWAEGSWTRIFIARQIDMFQYHRLLRGSGLLPPHVLSSPAWSWLLLKRPMMLHFEILANGLYREVLATGNPLVWFPAIPALVWTAVRAIRTRGHDLAATVGALTFGAGYLPWLVLTLGAEPYLFYMVPVVPFMCMAIGYCFWTLWTKLQRARPLLIAWGLLVVAAFIYLYPVLAARPLTRDAWIGRMLYRQCEPRFPEDAGQPPLPNRTGYGTWCWI